MNFWLHPARALNRSQALVLGSTALIITAVLASVAGLVNDGALDIHYHALSGLSQAPQERWLHNFAQGLANLAWSSLALLVASHLIKAPVAWLDWVAYIALARWPLVLISAYLAIPLVSGQITELSGALQSLDVNDGNHVMAPASHLLPAIKLLLWSLPSLAGLAWIVWLMFDAYCHLTQTRSTRTVLSFIGALISAQLMSQLTIF